jgi:hypothetical protein
VAGAQGEVQEESEWPEHEGKRERRNTERRADASAEAIKPNESPCDEVKGEHVQPHGKAPLWGRK